MTVSKLVVNGKQQFRLTYYDRDGKRRFLKLGPDVTQKRMAEQVDHKVQMLASAAAQTRDQIRK